jgi:hypothetical protein
MLTDKFVRSAPEGEHTDEIQRGLILLVRPSTSKSRPRELRRSWVLRAVHGGKRKRIGLGRYPAASLAVAREKAAEAIRQLEKGQDPTRKGRARLQADSTPRPILSSERLTSISPRRPPYSNIPRAKPAEYAACVGFVSTLTTG